MPTSRLLRSGLVLALAVAPGTAQTPFFADGTAFGGSRVFSEGLNPLGNSARLVQAPGGFYASWLEGGREASDAGEAIGKLAAGSASGVSQALRSLARDPWGTRLKGYGLAWVERGAMMSLTREELTGLQVAADADPAHLDSAHALALNTSTAELRRASVDRFVLGSSWREGRVTYGGTLRVERHALGVRDLALNPAAGQGALSGSAFDPWSFTSTSRRAVSATLDAGMAVAVSEALSVGFTTDRLLRRKIWDVEEKPQFRAGASLVLNSMLSVSAEADVNRAARFPFPGEQRTASASLRIALGQGLSLQVGAERTSFGGTFVARGGVMLRYRGAGMDLGLGFQAGADRPLKGASAAVVDL